MTIRQSVQELNPGALLDLLVFDTTSLGGSASYWTPTTNQLKASVVWQGQTYAPFPVEVTGWGWSGKGTMPRPTARLSNLGGFISAMCDLYEDLLGAKVTRKRTFVRYLDAVNFPGGVNPDADPNSYFPDEVFYVNRKVTETKLLVEFELTSVFDLQGIWLPRRQVLRHACTWQYRSAECSYAGGAVAKADDTPTAILAEDQCGHRLSSCKLRFGENAELPFGGFPGAGLMR